MSFTKMLEELNKCQWYWGAITPSTAKFLLKDRQPGTFLVRDSRSDKSIFSFSYVISTGVYHTRINCFNGKFCLGGPRSLIRSESLPEFVELTIRSCYHEERPGSSSDESSATPLRILMHPSSTEPAAQPIDIRYPLCRNQFIPSLRGACRLKIRRLIKDISLIDTLPLPQKLKKYLSVSNYLLTF